MAIVAVRTPIAHAKLSDRRRVKDGALVQHAVVCRVGVCDGDRDFRIAFVCQLDQERRVAHYLL